MTAIALKATLAVMMAFAVCAAARRRRASFRHAVYVALFLFLLFLPAAARLLPSVAVPVPSMARSAGVAPASIVSSPGRLPQPATPSRPDESKHAPAIDPATALLAAYVAGAALIAGWLASGVVRLRRLADRSEVWMEGTEVATRVACEDGIRRGVLVVLSDEIAVPMTFGFRRQTILLPREAAEWDASALRRALRHELEHVRRDDWAKQLMARVTCAVYWPHPLVWVALQRFCAEAERACDDAVLGNSDGAPYAEQLVTLARTIGRRPQLPALAMASPTRLSERVLAILDPSQRRGPHGRFAAISITVVMVFALTLSGSVRLVSAASREPQKDPAARTHPSSGRDAAKGGVAAGATGGVPQGVRGSVADGVAGGVRGGVNDGVRGGLNGGVEGAVRRGSESNETREIFGESVVRAAERGNTQQLAQLFDLGVNVNWTYDGDGSALLIAAKHGHLEAVKFLLERGADPNLPSPGDGNPLIAAADKGKTTVIDLLLDRGARIDEVVPGDENALITASGAGRIEAVRLLIRRGANVNARVWADDKEWRTPLGMARRAGHDDVARVLLEAGARD